MNVERLAAAPAPPRGVDVKILLGYQEGLDIEALTRKCLRACASAKAESVSDMRQLLEAKAGPMGRDVTGQLGLMICALNARHGERECYILIEHRADPT